MRCSITPRPAPAGRPATTEIGVVELCTLLSVQKTGPRSRNHSSFLQQSRNHAWISWIDNGHYTISVFTEDSFDFKHRPETVSSYNILALRKFWYQISNHTWFNWHEILSPIFPIFVCSTNPRDPQPLVTGQLFCVWCQTRSIVFIVMSNPLWCQLLFSFREFVLVSSHIWFNSPCMAF
jgi:hypothetical protein